MKEAKKLEQSIVFDGNKFPFGEFELRQSVLLCFNRGVNNAETTSVYRQPFVIGRPIEPIEVSESCRRTYSWDFCGFQNTGINGKIQIHLNSFFNCASEPSFTREEFNGIEVRSAKFLHRLFSFVATANSEEPVFLTYKIEVEPAVRPPDVGNSGIYFERSAVEVKVTVSSWSHDGRPATNVAISWNACAEMAALLDLNV